MEYSFKNFAIYPFVNDIVEDLRILAQDKGLVLTFAKPEFVGEVEFDSQKMHEVFQNLVENAIKYTPKGWITVELKSIGKEVIVSVKDSGRGMSAEMIPKLFKEYSRDAAVEEAIQGTGLGLFIAKQIVTDHQGRIWAESEGIDKGSTFSVALPMEIKR
jgi:hypothetical protein